MALNTLVFLHLLKNQLEAARRIRHLYYKTDWKTWVLVTVLLLTFSDFGQSILHLWASVSIYVCICVCRCVYVYICIKLMEPYLISEFLKLCIKLQDTHVVYHIRSNTFILKKKFFECLSDIGGGLETVGNSKPCKTSS